MRPPTRGADERRTRRSFLHLAGVAAVGLAGCTAESDESSSPTESPTRPPTATETEVTPETETYGPTDGPDERVTATPPGEPPLDSSGAWPQFRFDAGNTGYAPELSGLRDAAGYWTLDAGHAPSVADGTMYNVYAREEPKSFTRRDPRRPRFARRRTSSRTA
ncbi:hypothetical protein SAMN04488124_0177 [Halogeometricum limi]|uniref:Tat (Twin-arginine translocation) pathway signal sequence n=1 Tax=Halogeometricum limi TaxID=555875 RepID=A0A1I6FS55_9EURY|nr:hypothetical protein SAMN04488124_0177 [Halogeometricum limi]